MVRVCFLACVEGFSRPTTWGIRGCGPRHHPQPPTFFLLPHLAPALPPRPPPFSLTHAHLFPTALPSYRLPAIVCSSWTKRLITAYDYAAVQVNVGNVNSDGVYTGSFKTFALCGYIRDKVSGGVGVCVLCVLCALLAISCGAAIHCPYPFSPSLLPPSLTPSLLLQGESDRALRELVAAADKS